MAAAANAFTRGHSEVGHVASGPVDVPWGKTAEEAVEIQMNVTSVDLFSSQSKMEEDTGISRVSMSLAINGIDGALQNIGRMFGMPDTAFTGDLSASTDEVLRFDQDDIGEEVREIYSLGAGALASVRRVSAPRCKLTDVGPLAQSKTGWMVPSATWRVLNPNTAGVSVLTIRDLASS
jgi:hypothetical protein